MAAPDEPKKKEIYSYHAPWQIYGMNWSTRPDKRFRLAIGSFEEEYTNTVRIVQLDQEKQAFVETGELDHPYPTTKIMWMPDHSATHADLLATTGDYLRLWHVSENGTPRLECLLNNVRVRTRQRLQLRFTADWWHFVTAYQVRTRPQRWPRFSAAARCAEQKHGILLAAHVF